MLEILGPMGALTPADRFNNVKRPVARITKTPVGGVGDDVIYVTTGPVTSLSVKKGSSVIRLGVTGSPTGEAKTMEKALAQDALVKLRAASGPQ